MGRRKRWINSKNRLILTIASGIGAYARKQRGEGLLKPLRHIKKLASIADEKISSSGSVLRKNQQQKQFSR
jgi:hypothetical protein